MRCAAVLVAAGLAPAVAWGLAGCGNGAGTSSVRPHVSKLCVDVSVPLSGAHASVGAALVAGIRMQIPVGGVKIGAYRVRLCDIRDDAATARRTSSEAALANATRAAEALNTIADIGEPSSGDAAVAEAVLAPAGIPLLTPSGPIPRAPTTLVTSATSAQVRNTALFLLPSAATQANAVATIRDLHDCGARRRGRSICTVLGPTLAPLCTGIPTSRSRLPRYCVMGGPDLAAWSSPARAYGDGAVTLLLNDLRQVAAAGRDVADRSTVLGTLLHSHLSAKQSPIGAVRFDSQGAMEADDFSVYTVRQDGGLVLSQSLRTH